MENLFGILKETLCELHEQTNMHVAIVPNLITLYLLETFVIDWHETHVLITLYIIVIKNIVIGWNLHKTYQKKL